MREYSKPIVGASTEVGAEPTPLSVEAVGFLPARPHLAVIAVVDGTILVYDINAKVGAVRAVVGAVEMLWAR